MKKIHACVAALLAAAAALPASAQGVGRFVDAAHFPIDRSANTMGLGGASKQRLAQTLTVEVGGTLAGVFMPVICGTGRISVEIRDVDASGLPGTTVLASRTVAPAAFDTPERFTYVPIAGGLVLAAGQRIALVISNARGTCAYIPSPVGTDYAGGQGFFEALPNPPGWVPFSDFAGTFDDLPFQLVLD